MKEIGSNLQTTIATGDFLAGELANGTFATFTFATLLAGVSLNLRNVGGDGVSPTGTETGVLWLNETAGPSAGSTSLWGAQATGTLSGGSVSIRGGLGLSGNGGQLELLAGGSTSGEGGTTIIRGGDGNAAGGSSGSVWVEAGRTFGGATDAGYVRIGAATNKVGFYGSFGVTKQDLPANPTNAELATFLSNLGLANLV